MSPIALSGLASGLDTDSIITQLMSVERQPRDRMTLQDTQAKARQSQLQDLATKLTSVRDAAAALRAPTTWANVQSVGSSDASRVSVRAVGATAPGSHTFEVSQLAVKAQHAFAYAPSATTQSISIGQFTLTVDPSTSAANVAAALNARDDAPVSALVADGKLVLTSRTTGAANDFAVDATPLLDEDLVHARAGADAAYTVDGVAHTSASNVITDAVLGAEITLNAKTTAPVTVTVGDPGVDGDGAKSKVQAFVTAYNNTVDLIRGKLAEKPVPNATTSGDQAAGLFYGDQMLSGLLAAMRSQIGDLSDLGISTGAPSGTAKPSDDALAGHLAIDKVKLADALAKNPAGLATRVQAMAQRVTATIAPASGSPVDLRLTREAATRKDLATSMAATDSRLALKEKRLRAQFSAMESALAAAQAAQSQMASQLSALR